VVAAGDDVADDRHQRHEEVRHIAGHPVCDEMMFRLLEMLGVKLPAVTLMNLQKFRTNLQSERKSCPGRGAMPTEIHRDDVRGLLDRGAQLVEVLPSKEYEEEHLPGALSIPLKKLDRQTTARLRRDRPVIVYCYDSQ
jgi:hypothetical protein